MADPNVLRLIKAQFDLVSLLITCYYQWLIDSVVNLTSFMSRIGYEGKLDFLAPEIIILNLCAVILYLVKFDL